MVSILGPGWRSLVREVPQLSCLWGRCGQPAIPGPSPSAGPRVRAGGSGRAPACRSVPGGSRRVCPLSFPVGSQRRPGNCCSVAESCCPVWTCPNRDRSSPACQICVETLGGYRLSFIKFTYALERLSGGIRTDRVLPAAWAGLPGPPGAQRIVATSFLLQGSAAC